MPARKILLVVTCLVSVLTAAQPTENPDGPDGLPTSTDSDSGTAVLDNKCSGSRGRWYSVNPRTRERTRIYNECHIDKIREIVTGSRDRNSLAKQEQALLAQIEEATKLLDEANSYAAELDAELAVLRSSKQSLLAAIDSRNVSTQEVNGHNRIVKGAADDCIEYMARIEAMFGALIEREQNLDAVTGNTRTSLLNASTEIIAELEIIRKVLSAKWNELQGLKVYEKR
jgi:hypothetical protein